MTRGAVLEKMARAICPKVKPWLDAAHIKQSGICDCPGRYMDPQHGELITACFSEPLDAAAPVSAHITPEDRAAIVAKRATAMRQIDGGIRNMQRLVKVRLTLNAATRVEDRQLVRGLDDEAAELMRDAGAVIDGLAQLDAQAGIKFDGDLVRLRNLLTETWRDYRDAKAAKPAKLRKAKPSGERVRLLRERRKRGVRHIVQIEISDADLAVLIEAKLLTEDEAADQKSVAEVVEQILPRLLRAQAEDLADRRYPADPATIPRPRRFDAAFEQQSAEDFAFPLTLKGKPNA